MAYAKVCLISGKGTDSSRITVYTGSEDGKIVATTLIPSGAAFDATGDTPVQSRRGEEIEIAKDLVARRDLSLYSL